MNMFGFIRFNREVIADEISQAKAMLFDRLDSMTMEERTFNFGDDFIREMYDGAEQATLMKIRKYDEDHAQK